MILPKNLQNKGKCSGHVLLDIASLQSLQSDLRTAVGPRIWISFDSVDEDTKGTIF